MNVQEIRVIAKERGIKPGKLTKLALVKIIQHDEGNFPCFGTAITGECDQGSCLWRNDCFDIARKLQ